MDDLHHGEFKIGLPDGWRDRTEVVFVGPKRSGVSPAISLKRTALKAGQTLADLAASQLEGLQLMLRVTKDDIIEEGEATLAGIHAHMRVYHGTYLDRRITQRQICMIHDQTAYVLTASSTREHYAEDLPVFEEVIRRFQLNRR